MRTKSKRRSNLCRGYGTSHMLVGKLFLSPVAHAKIKSIDTRKLKLPGVKAIVHHLNTPKTPYNSYDMPAKIFKERDHLF